jgi:Tfp pilus assembly protein PilV
LLEVIVALAIVGIGVVTVLELFSSGLRLEARSRARSLASVYSRELLDEALARPTLGQGRESGSFDSTYGWTLVSRSLPDQTRLSSKARWELHEVVSRVRYREEGRDREVETKTLRLTKRDR